MFKRNWLNLLCDHKRQKMCVEECQMGEQGHVLPAATALVCPRCDFVIS